MDKVGKEGVITVEDGTVCRTNWTWLKVCSSTVATCSLLHQQAGNWRSRTGKPVHPLADKKISNIREMLPVLEAVAKQANRC